MSTFDKLIDQRIKQKVKQVEIAKHLNVTKSTMSNYEAKKRQISASDQDKYADYLGFELKLQLK